MNWLWRGQAKMERGISRPLSDTRWTLPVLTWTNEDKYGCKFGQILSFSGILVNSVMPSGNEIKDINIFIGAPQFFLPKFDGCWKKLKSYCLMSQGSRCHLYSNLWDLLQGTSFEHICNSQTYIKKKKISISFILAFSNFNHDILFKFFFNILFPMNGIW